MDEWDKKHTEDTEGLEKDIRQKFLDAILKAAALVTLIRAFRKEKPFRFEDYPATTERLQSLLKELSSQIESAIAATIVSEWDLANARNDALSDRVFGKRKDDLSAAVRSLYYARNEEARLAFQKRRIDGLGLSERVWNLTQQFRQEIELGLDIALRDGLSASQTARRLRQYLNEPERLFRRVRDEHGVLRLSQAAKAYHPGQGVYRSSYKNARRLAATETNMAYRTADYLRWQQLDFVVGIEIRLSNNHTCNGKPFHDICDELKGRYPKDFKFTGWHPLCRCYAISVLKTDEEMDEDTQKILNEEKPGTESRNAVKDVPDKFKKWISDNKDRIARSKSLPYFMRDNEKYVPQVHVTDEALRKAQATQKFNDELMKAARVGEVLPKPHFSFYKQYINGGSVQIMDGTDRKASDYRALQSIGRSFAKSGSTVQITRAVHYKDELYDDVFGGLWGTKYERKCPDLIVDGKYYEYEGYTGQWSKRKLKNMISHGLKQSDRIIINNNKGCSDRYIIQCIKSRILDKSFNYDIKEVWVYEKGKVRRLWVEK